MYHNLNELNHNKEKLIELNLNEIISNEELKSKILKTNNELIEINNKIELLKNTDHNNKLKQIEIGMKDILDVKYHLNVYMNLFIDKIVINKGETRHKMILDMYFRDGENKKINFIN